MRHGKSLIITGLATFGLVAAASGVAGAAETKAPPDCPPGTNAYVTGETNFCLRGPSTTPLDVIAWEVGGFDRAGRAAIQPDNAPEYYVDFDAGQSVPLSNARVVSMQIY